MAAVPSNPLRTETFHGWPLGINQSVPIHEIPDAQARWVQDILLDKAGESRQRGPVQASADITAAISGLPQGMLSMIAADGTARIAVLTGTSAPKLELLASDFTTKKQIAWGSETLSLIHI